MENKMGKHELYNVKNAIIEIFNIKGKRIRTLNTSTNSDLSEKINNVVWDGIDNQRNKVSSGVNFCRIKSEDFVS